MKEDFSQIMDRLTENARSALQKADYYSKKYNSGYMGTEHLLAGLMSREGSAAQQILRKAGISRSEIEDKFGDVGEEVIYSELAMMSLSESLVLTLRIAADFTRVFESDYIGTIHLLHALISQSNSTATRFLVELAGKQVIEKIKEGIELFFDEYIDGENSQRFKTADKQLRWLNKYGQNLTQLAKEDKISPAIGRESEIERIVTILSRRTKSNPVLIGEAGVGKTAIVEGLAVRIMKKNVPTMLLDKKVYQVDLSSVVAGTKFRGDFEERIKGIIDETIANPDVILFIDELHLLVGAGGSDGTMDAANLLKPALARGQIHLIGATTMDEFRKIEKDKALARRFQTVFVEEPSIESTLKILKGIKNSYEKHHKVQIPEEILETAINMSIRYINDRYMPDKVIDIIDESAALARVSADKKFGSEFRKLSIQKDKLNKELSEINHQSDFATVADIKTTLSKIDKRLAELKKQGAEEAPILTEDYLASAVSLKTGIPISKVRGSEAKLLIDLESHLRKAIIGQDEAIAAVSKAIRRGRSGIADPKRPIGSFIFMGPTGVGKTELARVIAQEVFGGENALIKIDMSEYSEKHNVSRLFGAPAGYVGYDEGGKLTEAIRHRPYSVVLFDEIEKAHPEVFNTLLQILEDGVLTDGHGNKVRFNNSIVILTSNLGAEQLFQESELGFRVKNSKTKKELENQHQESERIAIKALNKYMRPELVNRLDAILVFHALTNANVDKIFDNLISDLKKRLAIKKVGMTISEKAKKYLISLGFSPKYGARSLRRTIEEQLESLISDALISEKIQAGQIAAIDCKNKKLTINIQNESKVSSEKVILTKGKVNKI